VNKRPDLEPLSWFRANPDVKVAPAYADTQGTERGAFEAALGLVQRNGTRPQVFVGPSYSSESVVVSLLANVFEFATVSYSATSTRLSEKSTFPNFFRNVPSDAAQGRAMADLIRTKLSQTKVIVLHTDESYGLGLLNVFRVRANETGLEIPLVATLPPDFKRDDAVSALALVRERVYGVNGGIQDVGTFLYLGASPSEFAVVLAVAQEQKLIGHPFIWVTGDGGSTLALDKPEELNITAQNLVGMFGTQLAAATNDKFQKALNEPYQALLRNNTKVLVYGEELDYPTTISVYAPYAYDACAIVLTALNSLYSREIYNFTIAEMNDELRATKYDGTTGLNAFDKLQDREAVYDILNSYNGTWNKAFSYAEGKLQTGGGSGEAIFSSATDAKNTVPPVFALPPPPFNPGYIALIVVCLAVALLAAALVAAYFLRKAAKARKLKALEAQNAEPLFWTSAEEIEEIAPFEAQYDMDAKQVVATSSAEERTQYEVVRDSAVPLFGVARGTRCPVNEELLDVITLINHSAKPVRYTITVPTSGEEYAFELTAKPGVGTLKPKETRQINLAFKLLFTTKVNRWVKVVFEPPQSTASAREGSAPKGTYVAVRLEGVVSARIDPMELELYGKPIGEGAFGIVYRGKYRGTLVAAKVPRKQGEMREEQLKAFKEEIALFEKLRSNYIVNFIGASHVPGRLCICTELLERGTVFELIHKAKVSNVLKVKMLMDAANALAYLHKNGVLYRDMKPDNLLVTSVSHTAAVNVRLSDFGTAISVQNVDEASAHTGSIGTPAYMAPEIMANQPYNCKVDVYSLGMLSWEVFAEAVPFSFLKRVWDLPRLVLDGMRPELPSDWPKGVRDVISDCWLQAPEKRPSAENVATALERVFEPLKKDYEKSRKSKAQAVVEDDDGKQMPSKSRTAGTGQLDRIIEMGANQNPIDEPTGEGKVRRAADLRSTNDPDSEAPPSEAEPEETKPKKNKKKKKAAAAAAAAEDGNEDEKAAE
jgi:serine/threonine protein kinase/ABC-type branched-subunit amino acid transport system substrate-binding protein